MRVNSRQTRGAQSQMVSWTDQSEGPGALVGLDVGSTTVKLAVRREPRAPWTLRVARHHGRAREALLAMCEGLLPQAFALGATGSGAGALTQRVNGRHTHELSAALAAARALRSDVGTIIDLGGQDAKLVILSEGEGRGPLFTMNDRCAAGTGVTIDRCLARLGIAAELARGVRFQPAATEPLSARCGVFAETDLVNLARRGAAPAVLISSLADAIVRANLSVLVRGVTPRPPVLLLGGPHAHLPALVEAWRFHLCALWRERETPPGEVLVPDDAVFFSAIGAALVASELAPPDLARGAAFRRALRDESVEHSAPLDSPFAKGVEAPCDRPRWPTRSVEAKRFVLGVDAGSTVTKAVLLDEGHALRMSTRRPSGEPAEDARTILAEARAALAEIAPWAVIESAAVTGYGAPWMAPLLGADADLIETAAHALSARAVAPDAAMVCDVGGQDIKVLTLAPDGSIRDFDVSSQCSAGIGMALESTARELGTPRERYAERAFSALRAPRFTDGCVVFLDAERVSLQRHGFSPDEILAGLARALPRVVWSQVARGLPRSLNGAVVLQGGVQRNDAAVRAQVEHLVELIPGARVVVHPHPDLAGALGAALFALGRSPGARASVRLAVVASVEPHERCGLCESGCPRATLRIDSPCGPRRLLVGNACDAGAVPSRREGARLRRARAAEVPDLYAWEGAALFRRDPSVSVLRPARRRVRVAIPRVLAQYRAAPLFRAYLEGLGVASRDVIFSPATNPTLWAEGSRHGSTDPCFPVRLVLAHTHHLLRSRRARAAALDALFVPRVTRAVTPVRHCADCASCPVVAASPALVKASFGDELDERGIRLIAPELSLAEPTRLREQLYEAFGELLDVTRDDSDRALVGAAAALARFESDLQFRGRQLLDACGEGRGLALVIARPYHADPGISHHVGAELQSLGYPSIGIRALPRDPAWLSSRFADELGRGVIADPFDLRDILPESDNSGGAERVWAARVAARHRSFGVIDLSSFKCAQDAPTAAPIASILRGAGTVHCALHDLDETRPRVSLRVRLRTFAHAMRERGLAPWT